MNGIALMSNGQPNKLTVSLPSARIAPASSAGGSIIVRPTGENGSGRITE